MNCKACNQPNCACDKGGACNCSPTCSCSKGKQGK
jgi:hypothetical protein